MQVVWDALLVGAITGTPEMPGSIGIMGHSLGTGISLAFFERLHHKEVRPRFLVLEAPFTSLPNVVRDTYLHYLPVNWHSFILPYILDSFPSSSNIQYVSSPLFIAHGKNDNVIPSAQGELLFSRAKATAPGCALSKNSCMLCIVPDATHSDLVEHAMFTANLSAFLRANGPAKHTVIDKGESNEGARW